jgi:hypothetical protein
MPGGTVSTTTENSRCSPCRSAPTPTSWRAISSPRSFRIVTSIVYSVVPAGGPLRVPSTRRASTVGRLPSAAVEVDARRWCRHCGQTAALSSTV